MFQQHQVQIFYDHVNLATRRTIDHSADGKLHDRNAEESWALLEDLALYDNESWNNPRDFAKPVMVISLPQGVPSTSNRRLIKLEDQVQRLMEAHLDPKSSAQVNKITYSCDICSGPHDTQYCMENPEQAFVDYASSRSNEVGGEQNRSSSSPKHVYFINTITVIRKEDESRKAGTIRFDAAEDIGRDTFIKEVNEVEMESEELKKEIKEEIKEEEEYDPEYFNTFPTIEELAVGWLLEEIHVTWAHLKQKRTRLPLYTKSLEEYVYSAWRRRQILL
ncbi:hypothetical protein Tco_0205617 [Tanacetum coccineum]